MAAFGPRRLLRVQRLVVRAVPPRHLPASHPRRAPAAPDAGAAPSEGAHVAARSAGSHPQEATASPRVRHGHRHQRLRHADDHVPARARARRLSPRERGVRRGPLGLRLRRAPRRGRRAPAQDQSAPADPVEPRRADPERLHRRDGARPRLPDPARAGVRRGRSDGGQQHLRQLESSRAPSTGASEESVQHVHPRPSRRGPPRQPGNGDRRDTLGSARRLVDQRLAGRGLSRLRSFDSRAPNPVGSSPTEKFSSRGAISALRSRGPDRSVDNGTPLGHKTLPTCNGANAPCNGATPMHVHAAFLAAFLPAVALSAAIGCSSADDSSGANGAGGGSGDPTDRIVVGREWLGRPRRFARLRRPRRFDRPGRPGRFGRFDRRRGAGPSVAVGGRALLLDARGPTPGYAGVWAAFAGADPTLRQSAISQLQAAVSQYPKEEEFAVLLGLANLWRVVEPLP